jgi:hypothetical protein
VYRDYGKIESTVTKGLHFDCLFYCSITMSQDDSQSLANSSPFTTTSDVLRHLNESIQRMQQHEDDKLRLPAGKFELQTRLPDGSARPANEEETASADFQNKLQQATAYVAALPTRAEKLNWCERQRLYGNSILSGGGDKNNYRAAMDVYLTCLAVAADTSLDNDDHDHQRQRLLLFAKVLNNLAVCTMEMSWYQKTVQFCTMGLKHLSEYNHRSIDQDDDREMRIQKCKLYFKRAKASRLRGEYKSAKIDLVHAREQCCSWSDNHDTEDGHAAALVQFVKIIDKEEQLLNQAVKRAKRNLDVQKRAMRQILGSPNPPPDTPATCAQSENANINPTTAKRMMMMEPLYDDLEGEEADAVAGQRRRRFSTLRAPDEENDEKTEEDQDQELVPPTYWQMYLQKVARQARRVLDWLNDLANTKID